MPTAIATQVAASAPADVSSCEQVQEKCARLRVVAEQLGHLSSETEQEFLAVGQRLYGFAASAQELSGLAGGAAAAASGAEGKGDLSGLTQVAQEAFADLLEWQRDIAASHRRLGELRPELRKLTQVGRDLHKIARHLRMVGLYTAIEAASISEGGTRLNSFHMEVMRLGERVRDQSDELVGLADVAASAATSAHAEIAKGMREFAVRVEECRRSVDDSVNSLAIILARSDDGTRQMADAAAAISRDVGEVVASLQFHDIARQRIEHVQEAVVEAAEGLSELTGCEDAEAATVAMARGRHALRVQEAQLRAVGEGSREAAEQLVRGLMAIAENCSSQAAAVGAMGSGVGTDIFRELGDDLSGLSRRLEQGRELGERIVQSVAAAVAAAEKMGAWAAQIGAVSREILMLGFNSVVITARLGHQGRTLTVCADEICSLAATATETISDAIRRLERIGQQASCLRDETNAALQVRTERHAALDGALQRSLAELAQVHETVTEARDEVGYRARELSRSISGTLDEIRFDRQMVSQIQDVSGELAEMCELLEATAQTDAGHVDLEDIASRYTMEEELRIHRDVLGGADGAGPEGPSLAAEGAAVDEDDDVLLWEMPGDTSEDPADAGADLGDNVELF